MLAMGIGFVHDSQTQSQENLYGMTGLKFQDPIFNHFSVSVSSFFKHVGKVNMRQSPFLIKFSNYIGVRAIFTRGSQKPEARSLAVE